MRGESRSRSKSPSMGNESRGNDSRGDRGPSDPPTNKVYVTFLPEDIDEAKLKEVFEECGRVTRVSMKKKEDGFTFAHIHYETVSEAQDAIEKLNRRRINNKNIKVQFGRDRVDSKDGRGDSRDRNDRFGGGQDRGGPKGDYRKESDTRRRFENQGGFESRDRGGGRGRGGGFRDNNQRGGGGGGFREDRGPMKCFKCQGMGHMAKNCTAAEGGESRRPQQGSDYRQSKPVSKPVDKMSEDQFEDY